MDKATILKVINGISEKLEKFIDSIDKKFDLAGDLFKKLQNQIKDLKSEDLEIFDKIKDLSIRIDEKIYSKIAVDDKIKELNDKIMVMAKANMSQVLSNRIGELDDKIKELEQKANRTGQFHLDAINEKFAELNKKISTINHKIVKYGLNADKLEKQININKDNCVSNNDYKKLWEENTDDYNFLACKRLEDYTKGIKNSESIDNLESKYYKLRSELDSIYKVLEMDALDIQDLYNKIDKHPKNKEELNQETLEILIKEQDENAK